MKKFNLSHEMFSAATFDLYEDDNFRVSTFKYPSGVEALKVSNSRGYLTLLPFYGRKKMVSVSHFSVSRSLTLTAPLNLPPAYWQTGTPAPRITTFNTGSLQRHAWITQH